MRSLVILFSFGIFSTIHAAIPLQAGLKTVSFNPLGSDSRQGLLRFGGRDSLDCLQYNADKSITISRYTFDNPTANTFAQLWDLDNRGQIIQSLAASKLNNNPAPLEKGSIVAVDDERNRLANLVEGVKLMITEFTREGGGPASYEHQVSFETSGTGGNWDWIKFINDNPQRCLRATNGVHSRTSSTKEWQIINEDGLIGDSFILVACRAEDEKIRFDFKHL